jgi:hypothetical protein
MIGKLMRQLKNLVHIVAFSLVLVIISTGCISGLDPRSFNSAYSYEVSIVHHGPLSNATFIIPLAVRDNSPELASDIFIESDFAFSNVTASLIKSPSGLDLNNVSSIDGYDPWFLIIKLESPISESSPYYIYKFEKDIQVKLDDPDFRVNTLIPIGNETLISPKNQFVRPDPPQIRKRGVDRIEYTSLTVPYSTIIYADYSAPSSTLVEIYCNVRGTNYWREYSDAGGRNQYQDKFSRFFSGEVHGWYQADGDLTIADGFYPNLDHPEWQDALNRTASGSSMNK